MEIGGEEQRRKWDGEEQWEMRWSESGRNSKVKKKWRGEERRMGDEMERGWKKMKKVEDKMKWRRRREWEIKERKGKGVLDKFHYRFQLLIPKTHRPLI